MRPPAWSMERCCRLLSDRSNERVAWVRAAFIAERPPGSRREPLPPGGSVLYKRERALAAVVQSEVGSVGLTSIAVQHSI